MIKIIISSLSKVVPEQELQSKVLWRSVGVMAWVSFVFAGIASMLFFATFDPLSLGKLATFSVEWSAQAVYTIGFLLFWLLGFSSTLGSVILLALPLAKRQRSLPE
tara:strand:- start:234 stop:551 length:318 start_codon:yes stop_codon:yes gene_type:complete